MKKKIKNIFFILTSSITILIFTIFFFFPYPTYHYLFKIIPNISNDIETININWTNEVEFQLDSIKKSYFGKRYIFPKPPYLNVKFNGENAKIRFKGDYCRHIQRKEWSFRYKSKEKNSWNNLKKINFHHPAERLDINEYVFIEFMKNQGLLAIDYNFSYVIINDSVKRFYAYEEAIDKSFLKKRNLDGIIFRYDEAPFFNWMMYHTPESFPDSIINYFFNKSKLYNTNKTSKINIELFNRGKSKIEKWRKGNIKTSEIFDLEKTAKFFAITDLLGAKHGIGFNNIRLFYDIETEKFEIIANDGESRLNNKCLIEDTRDEIKLFFADNKFKERYFYYLKRYSSGHEMCLFLIKNIFDIKSKSKLIEQNYPESENNLAYIHYNIQKLNSFSN